MRFAYKHYLLSVLLVIFIFNTIDRVALGIVLQDIKVEFALSDTQLGVLTGIAFALFYSVMGVPIARWADRGNRVTIIALSTVLWSGAVALLGAAGSFLQLLLIRVGVAVGESGCTPPAHSLIADHFSRAERPRAIGRYMLGVPLSMVIGYFLAGWLNELYGWRVVFVVLGLPGLALAVLAWLTLKEPRCEHPVSTGSATHSIPAHSLQQTAMPLSPQPSMKNVCTLLWANTTFRHLLLGWSVASFFGSGILQWKPAFFIRTYGLSTGELGTWFAVIYGLGGLLGGYLGGEWASRYAVHNERLQLKAVGFAYCGLGVISTAMYLSPNQHMALGLMWLTTLVGYATQGPFFATIQTLVPPQMRATATAITYLFANLIGMGLGPLAVGALSDVLRPWTGEYSLRYALLALCPGYFWVAWHLWRGSRAVARDLLRADPEGGSESSPLGADLEARNV